MRRKALVLSFAVAAISGGAVRSAMAQFLPGNDWPNAGLSTAAPAGVDQVYSYYNTPFYTPNTVGDTNPRPDGWHRGGGDFWVTSAPSYCFYNTPGNTAGEGTAPPGNSDGYALEVTDNNVNGYGEWFSDWNALPAGNSVYLRFFYENIGIQPRGDNARVTAYFGDSTGSDVSNAPNQIGNGIDFLIPGGSPDNTTWTEVDEVLPVPAGAHSLRITEDSGGGGDVTGTVYLSDISLSSVPEPASLALVASGAMLLMGRKRRA